MFDAFHANSIRRGKKHHNLTEWTKFILLRKCEKIQKSYKLFTEIIELYIKQYKSRRLLCK